MCLVHVTEWAFLDFMFPASVYLCVRVSYFLQICCCCLLLMVCCLASASTPEAAPHTLSLASDTRRARVWAESNYGRCALGKVLAATSDLLRGGVRTGVMLPWPTLHQLQKKRGCLLPLAFFRIGLRILRTQPRSAKKTQVDGSLLLG